MLRNCKGYHGTDQKRTNQNQADRNQNSYLGKQMDRQSFLKTVGKGVVIGTGISAAAASSANKKGVKFGQAGFAQEKENESEKKKAMLVDTAECVGCNACTRVCRETWDLSEDIYRTEIKEPEEDVFYKSACQHCHSPSCVEACPTEAMYINDLGFTVIDHASCVRCNYCVANCPYDAIQFDKQSGVIEKCDFCAPAVEQGAKPACVEGCPIEAIKFGDRDELIEYGEERVQELQENGNDKAYLYGIDQMDGLSVLAVLANDPEKYNLPQNPETPLSVQLWDKIPLLPMVMIGGGVVLGFNFLHSRKNQKLTKQNGRNYRSQRREK